MAENLDTVLHMEENRYKKLTELLDVLREETDTSNSSLDDVPSVALLLALLKIKIDLFDKFVLLTLLKREYSLLGNINGEEWAHREGVRIHPEHPLPYISLANFLSLHFDVLGNCALTESKSIIEEAITIAQRTGDYVIHAYTTKARICMRSEDYEQFYRTLEKLIEFQPSSKSEDVNYESEFLSRIPAKFINKDIIEKFCEKISGER